MMNSSEASQTMDLQQKQLSKLNQAKKVWIHKLIQAAECLSIANI